MISRNTNLLEFFESFYCPLRLVNRSPRTKTLYRYSIKLLGDFLGRPATLEDFNDLTIARHLEYLIAQGRAPSGVNKERDQLVALWNLAARKKLVDEFPAVQRVNEPYRIPWAWTQEELWRLRISCNMQVGSYDGIPANLWWTALHIFLFSTGERIRAVLKAEWADIQRDSIVFPAENRKGAKRPGICHLGNEAMEWLQKIRQPERKIIFPWPFSESHLYIVYKKILKRAELDNCSKSKFHRMRRTHATQLKIAGGDPTQSLGHQSPVTTHRYLDPRQIPSGVRELLPTMGQSPYQNTSDS